MGILDEFKDTQSDKESVREAGDILGEQEGVAEVAASATEEKKGLLETVESSLGGLEKLARKIPGYGGDKEKKLRTSFCALS